MPAVVFVALAIGAIVAVMSSSVCMVLIMKLSFLVVFRINTVGDAALSVPGALLVLVLLLLRLL